MSEGKRVNWRRGFFRVWVLGAVLWIPLSVFEVADDLALADRREAEAKLQPPLEVSFDDLIAEARAAPPRVDAGPADIGVADIPLGEVLKEALPMGGGMSQNDPVLMADGKLAASRAQYPQYDDMSDMDLARALHRKFYAHMAEDEFMSRLGLMQVSEPEVPVSPPEVGAALDASYYLQLAAVAFLPPLVALIAWFLFGWVYRGFRTP